MRGAQFNAGEWLVHRHVAEGRGDRVAVRGSETLTYAALSRLVGTVTASFRTLGLRRDDRIVFVTNDDVPMFAGVLAAFSGGFVAVPVSTMLGAHELAEIVADSGAAVVVASADYAANVAEAVAELSELRYIVAADGDAISPPPGAQSLTWAELLAAGEGAPEDLRLPAVTGEDAWALWLYTSGTTGSPKGAMHRHANIRHVCQTYGDQVLGIRPDDRCFSIAKLFFAYGIGNSMFFPLSVGASSVLEPRRPTPAVVGERVRAEQPTLFFGVPTFYAGLAASDLPDDTFASVRLGTSAGEALPSALMERFRRRFGMDIIDGIGSTEALHIFVSNRPGDIHPGSSGVPVPGYEIELRDAAGQVVPDGEPGNLWVRGESIALGYWRRTAASRSVFVGEWLSTGDTYVRSADGVYTCMGRSNDLLKAGGIWVSPAEVESRLLEHELVSEVAVVGIPDADGLDKPVAVVVRKGEVTEAELVQFCRDGLAAFKRPRAVYFVSELPKTATGKMQRYKVRETVQRLAAQAAAHGVPSTPEPAELVPADGGPR